MMAHPEACTQTIKYDIKLRVLNVNGFYGCCMDDSAKIRTSSVEIGILFSDLVTNASKVGSKKTHSLGIATAVFQHIAHIACKPEMIGFSVSAGCRKIFNRDTEQPLVLGQADFIEIADGSR